MPIDPSYAGRTYPPTEPYEVGVEKIREFADAIGDQNPPTATARPRRALGHPDVIAPPTFPFVLTFQASRRLIDDPDSASTTAGSSTARSASPTAARSAPATRSTVTRHARDDPVGRRPRHDHLARRRRAPSTGEHVVTAWSTLVVRGGRRRDHGDPRYDDVAVGTELPAQTFPIRRADLVRYAGASGDFNVIHWNERIATSVGLPDVIAHGMFTMAARRAGRHRLGRRPGRGRRLRRPLHPAGAGARRRRGRPVEVTGAVAAMLDDGRVRVDLTATPAGAKVLGRPRPSSGCRGAAPARPARRRSSPSPRSGRRPAESRDFAAADSLRDASAASAGRSPTPPTARRSRRLPPLAVASRPRDLPVLPSR